MPLNPPHTVSLLVDSHASVARELETALLVEAMFRESVLPFLYAFLVSDYLDWIISSCEKITLVQLVEIHLFHGLKVILLHLNNI